MAADFVIKQHDTRPILRITLKDNGVAVDLTNATSVKLLLKSLPNPPGSVTVSRAAAFVSPRTSGQVDVTFQSADTATTADYSGEVEVTWADGGIETWPNDTYLGVSVIADLG